MVSPISSIYLNAFDLYTYSFQLYYIKSLHKPTYIHIFSYHPSRDTDRDSSVCTWCGSTNGLQVHQATRRAGQATFSIPSKLMALLRPHMRPFIMQPCLVEYIRSLLASTTSLHGPVQYHWQHRRAHDRQIPPVYPSFLPYLGSIIQLIAYIQGTLRLN